MNASVAVSVPESMALAADRIVARIPATSPLWGSYFTELALEAWLLREEHRGAESSALAFALVRKDARREAAGTRIPWEQRPFVSLEWQLAQCTGDERYLAPWLEETRRWQRESSRSPQGIVQHRAVSGRHAVIVDDLQEYTSRCLRGGAWAGEDDLIEEGVVQWERAELLLRDRVSGLWSQGQGWRDDPAALSPGAWSRGHGWLLRGLAQGLLALEDRPEAFARVQLIYQRAVEALAAVQAPGGAWPSLLHLPADESPPDSSGTGMIVYFTFQGWKRGWLPDRDAWAARLARAVAWLADRVSAEGRVLDSCPGPGPLTEEAPYRRAEPWPPGEPHGVAGVLLASVAAQDEAFPWAALVG